MCVLIGEEEKIKVADTSIFVRMKDKERQFIVYSLKVFTDKPAALVLPIPVKPGLGDSALDFINLSGYEDFFTDMHDACEPAYAFAAGSSSGEPDGMLDLEEEPPLVVHEVGEFEASYVPSQDDFKRLDSRFQLAPEVWEAMPDYSDYGFAVFQLKPSSAKDIYHSGKTVHPMAFEFVTRHPHQCFFPTVHVHDRHFYPRAKFDHTLFVQLEADGWKRIQALSWEFEGKPFFSAHDEDEDLPMISFALRSSTKVAKDCMDVDKSQGILVPDKKIYAYDARFTYDNRDYWI